MRICKNWANQVTIILFLFIFGTGRHNPIPGLRPPGVVACNTGENLQLNNFYTTKMKKIFFICFILFLKTTISIGQNITSKTINYENGNSLIVSDFLELKDKNNNTICTWDKLETTIRIKNKDYITISKTESGQQKMGLFDLKNGLLTIPISYDYIRPMESDNGVILTKAGKYFGLINVELLVTIPPIYEMFFYYKNGNYLLKKGTVAFETDNKLQILDSITGFKDVQYINYKMNKKFSIVYTLSGTYLFDSENTLIEYDKKWTKIYSEFSGDNLIISTKGGYGLFNFKTRKVAEPFVNRFFETKPFYNEQIIFAEKNKWKLFDSSGKKLLEIIADSIVPAIDGEWRGFFFKQKSLWGFVDIYGKILQKPIWKSMWNPRLEYFEATLTNGKVKNYTYEYKSINSKKIITKVLEAEIGNVPPN